MPSVPSAGPFGKGSLPVWRFSRKRCAWRRAECSRHGFTAGRSGSLAGLGRGDASRASSKWRSPRVRAGRQRSMMRSTGDSVVGPRRRTPPLPLRVVRGFCGAGSGRHGRPCGRRAARQGRRGLWLASATSVAPSRMSWLQPAELACRSAPAPRKTGLPYSEARFAVINEPDHAGHSTTNSARDHAATMRLRIGNVCLSGAVCSGNSETTAPSGGDFFRERQVFRRIELGQSRADHRDGPASRRHRRLVGRRIDSPGQAGDDGEPGLRELIGQLLGRVRAVMRRPARAHHADGVFVTWRSMFPQT